jgi:hypothetical protein
MIIKIMTKGAGIEKEIERCKIKNRKGNKGKECEEEEEKRTDKNYKRKKK